MKKARGTLRAPLLSSTRVTETAGRPSDGRVAPAETAAAGSRRGDGLGYDIHSFDAEGEEMHIEIKTTNGG